MLAWVWLLWHIVAALGPHQTNFPRRLLLGWVVIVGSTTAALGLLAAHSLIGIGSPRLSAALGLVIALLGLSLTETLYRSYQAIDRWGIKFLCLRSEEHTSELQSLMRISYAVFCLKKTKTKIRNRKI